MIKSIVNLLKLKRNNSEYTLSFIKKSKTYNY